VQVEACARYTAWWHQRHATWCNAAGSLLCRQFRKEEERARARGEYSPPGLLNVEQFRHAFKKFSIKVSEEQAMAMFIKYGHDSQVGLRCIQL
jgi:hypothetical protein